MPPDNECVPGTFGKGPQHRYEHGVNAGYGQGCRGLACTAAHAEAQRDYKRRKKAGEIEPRKPSTSPFRPRSGLKAGQREGRESVRNGTDRHGRPLKDNPGSRWFAMDELTRKKTVLRLYEKDTSIAEIAWLCDVNYRTVQRIISQARTDGLIGDVLGDHKEPVAFDQLSPAHQACLADTPEGFIAFCEEFWPEHKVPAHIKLVVRRSFDYDTGLWRSNIILNIGTGFAKSIYFARRWGIWRVAQRRSFRFGIVSETNQLASDWVTEISEELVGNRRLTAAFGPFYNPDPNCWRPGHGMIKVLGAGRGVRWSIIGRGRGQQLQGMRLDEIVIDDPETPETIMSIEDRERVVQYNIDYVAENRLEPGTGIIRLIATRFALRDIPGILAERRYDDGRPKWEHVAFPALFDPATGEASIAPDAISLWPERFPVKVLRAKLDHLTPILFDPIYQQNPRPEGSSTFDMEWVTAEHGDHADLRRGCLDRARSAGKGATDEDWSGEKVRVFSLDPSGTAGWWAMVVADVPAYKDSSQFRAVIVDIRRGRWTTQEFLNQVESVCAAHHPRFFIPESNMRADLWNGDNRDFTRLKLEHHFQVKAHRTQQNKRDLVWGVESLALDFLDGRIRIPYGDDHSRSLVKQLITEIYEHPNGRTDDILMALWFLKAAWRRLYAEPQAETIVNGGWEKMFSWATG